MVTPSDLSKIQLDRNGLSFDEYIRRVPEKLELIKGFLGTNEEDAKELLAMSLQSFGLIEVVRYAPKELWIEALNAAYPEENQNIE